PPLTSRIMREEIFGQALVVLSYSDIHHVVEEINQGERPLALYYFGSDQVEQHYVLGHTLSGGVSINDALMHAALENAPFGGVGASGLGRYYGHEGFLEFSHVRTVYQAPATDPRGDWGMLPPYHEGFTAVMQSQISRCSRAIDGPLGLPGRESPHACTPMRAGSPTGGSALPLFCGCRNYLIFAYWPSHSPL